MSRWERKRATQWHWTTEGPKTTERLRTVYWPWPPRPSAAPNTLWAKPLWTKPVSGSSLCSRHGSSPLFPGGGGGDHRPRAGKKVLLGNLRLLEERGIAAGDLGQAAEQLAEQGKTPMYVVVDGVAAGIIRWPTY